MKRIQRMSDAERQIMEFIWAAGHPVTTKEILTFLPEGKTWKQNTVITFLARLVKKGVIRAERAGKANYYDACITEQQYKNFETRQFVDEVHKGSVFGFLAALCENGDLTKEDIESLAERLKK